MTTSGYSRSVPASGLSEYWVSVPAQAVPTGVEGDLERPSTVSAIYLVRFGYLGAWPIRELCAQLAGRPIDLTQLRAEFAEVLLGPLRTYWNQRSR